MKSITTNNNENANLEKLEEKFAVIRQNFEELTANDKSSADKSYVIGRYLIELHTDNSYRQLKDKENNGFRTWQDFCVKGCGFSRIYADRLEKCAKMQDRLEEAGVTTVKQSVANLYMLQVAEKKHGVIVEAVWKAATGNSPEMFPERKAVLKAINPQAKSSSTPQASTFDKVRNSLKSLSKEELKLLVTYIESLRKGIEIDNDSPAEVPAASDYFTEKVSA